MSRLMVSVSGVRGEIGRTLTPEIAAQFGSAFGTMLGAGATVVVGRDSRPSGPMIRSAVISGLLACGVRAIDLGLVTTPGAALMTGELKADGGVVITASHNPLPWNGIKFLRPTGLGLSVEAAARLKQIWESRDYAYVDPARCGTETTNDSTHATHVGKVLSIVDVKAIARRRFKVVLDSVNGAGGVGTAMLLKKLGCELIPMNAEPTGLFAHTPEPTEANLTDLCAEVARCGAAVGFAQDPDADRLALVDEHGTYIGEEYTLALCAAYVLGGRTGSAAANLSTSRMIDDIAARHGGTVFRTPVGEANVAGRMLEEGCIIGGEGNGGIIDPRVVPVRDSMAGMALVLAYLTATGRTLGELVGDIPRYAMIKAKFPCPADAAPKVAAAARKQYAGRKGAAFNDSDGLRIDLPSGWVHVRASNTEPIMRIIAEAPARDAAEALVEEVRQIAEPFVKG
ncbi:MAG: phosphoglucosamine mutase [Planctomycetes bacterium]|nr:phosphoglucosamine mutase [Planctomycetota bacterium]